MILAIYGTGGSGLESYEQIMRTPELKKRWDDFVFIDDTKEVGTFQERKCMPFQSFCLEYPADSVRLLISLGEPKYREMLYERVHASDYRLATIVHPTAIVSVSATLGEGVFIQDNVSVSSEAIIGDNVWINGKTIIGHHSVIGSHSTVCSFSIIAGHTTLDKCTYVGVSSAIRDELTIGAYSIISMGSVVMRDVRPEKIVMGNPAREVADNTNHLVFSRK